MTPHEAKSCPRCRQPFACKPGNITQCQCYGLVITDREKAYMREAYEDCLCRDCLKAIRHELRCEETQQKIKSILSIFDKS